MIVADSTLLVHFALPVARVNDVLAAKDVYRQDSVWRATPLWKSEVRNVGVKYMRAGDLSLGDLTDALAVLDDMLRESVETVEHDEVLRAALGFGLSGYDAEYVALAERLGVPLVTSDKRVLLAVGRAVAPGDFAASAPR